MSKALDKAEREAAKASAKLSSAMAAPAGAGVWGDEEFWARRWPALVDRLAGAVEEASAARGKAGGA